jgi:putative phosphoesterase
VLAGVIADTHGYLDERVAAHFDRVDVILHAGDIGSAAVLDALGRFAPVLAVLGNNDSGSDLPLSSRLLMEIEGHRVQLVHEPAHIVASTACDVVVFGHTHKVLNERRESTLYLNPGAAGRRGFHAVQSVALLRLNPGVPAEAELITLGPRLSSAPGPATKSALTGARSRRLIR